MNVDFQLNSVNEKSLNINVDAGFQVNYDSETDVHLIDDNGSQFIRLFGVQPCIMGHLEWEGVLDVPNRIIFGV